MAAHRLCTDAVNAALSLKEQLIFVHNYCHRGCLLKWTKLLNEYCVWTGGAAAVVLKMTIAYAQAVLGHWIDLQLVKRYFMYFILHFCIFLKLPNPFYVSLSNTLKCGFAVLKRFI